MRNVAAIALLGLLALGLSARIHDYKDETQCYQCHGSGKPSAAICAQCHDGFGGPAVGTLHPLGASVTCLSCHYPHDKGAGMTKPEAESCNVCHPDKVGRAN